MGAVRSSSVKAGIVYVNLPTVYGLGGPNEP